MPRDTDPPVPTRLDQGGFEVLITAAEAWPAFEHAVLDAQDEVIGGFRIFDLSTKLVSPRAKQIGEDWFDLLAHILARGVRVEIIVSDFDPVMATELHKATWNTVRQGMALAEISDAGPEQLQIRAARHPARAGLIPRLAFALPVRAYLKRAVQKTKAVDRARNAVGLDRTGRLPELLPATHHHKLAVIDGEVLYLGGLDLNARRWDTPAHGLPARKTWSDVQIILRGLEAQAARDHLKSFEAVCTGAVAPLPRRHNFLRTLSAPRNVQFPFLSPQTVLNDIERAHIGAINHAKHCIHIETQFLRSSRIVDALVERAWQEPRLGLILILPALPEGAAFDADVSLDTRFGLSHRQRALARLRGAFRDRLVLATPVQSRMAARDSASTYADAPIIYVHNKVMVVDDVYAIVGSANLNGRSLRWDTEAALELTRPERVAALRAALARHWWHLEVPEEAMAPDTMTRWWAKSIARNAVRHPENRDGFLVPLDPSNASDLVTSVPGVTEDLV